MKKQKELFVLCDTTGAKTTLSGIMSPAPLVSLPISWLCASLLVTQRTCACSSAMEFASVNPLTHLAGGSGRIRLINTVNYYPEELPEDERLLADKIDDDNIHLGHKDFRKSPHHAASWIRLLSELKISQHSERRRGTRAGSADTVR